MSYTDQFYEARAQTAQGSAQQIVPWVVKLIKPESVVDVGCGTGSWLSVFMQHGINDVLGIDGHWVPRDRLEIPADTFSPNDLSGPIHCTRKFDLVVSLEVAEHLPNTQADEFVQTLTRLGPLILFSAAHPRQGGVGHVNEQWPGYWIERFRQHGYDCIDCIRGKFWLNESVAPWYPQNMFFFVDNGRLQDYGSLIEAEKKFSLAGMPVIHPRQYFNKINELSDPTNYSIRKFMRVMPKLMWHKSAKLFGPSLSKPNR
jgi:SAM-dependent methyltransferase